jgi:hypothetical protein
MTPSEWLALFQASGINLGSQVYVLLDVGGAEGGVLTGTVVVIAAAGNATYLRLALSQPYGVLPIGALVTVIADHIAAVAPVVVGGGD